MFHILGILFFIVLAVLIVGLLLALKLVNSFFNLGKRMTGQGGSKNDQRNTYQKNEEYSQQTSSSNHRQSQQPTEKHKVFDDDEGEYIEFEEIKD